jgi:menaquinone-9 beta-reductase
MERFDVVICGGGLGGAALGKVLAEAGVRTLILERETQFRDRVRGEAMLPWGAPDVAALGLDAAFDSAGAVDVPLWEEARGQRDLHQTTPSRRGFRNFYHPAMQEALLAAASYAGATVRRGVRVTGVTPGSVPRVTFAANGAAQHVQAELVAGADGRDSRVRQWAGFARRQDPPRMIIAGLLWEGLPLPADTSRMILRPDLLAVSFIFPQDAGRFRVYFAAAEYAGYPRLSGARDVSRFVECCTSLGLPPELFAGAEPAGPLASFNAAATWVDHPYRDGVVLIGDAAASSDPTWGSGLSLTVRDVRLLSDRLAELGDLRHAADAYAADHDQMWGRLHHLHNWVSIMAFDTGPEADARRARAFAAIRNEPGRALDLVGLGPDQPVDDALRQRYFAEDLLQTG